MPSMPPRPCTQARCTKYAIKDGRCDEHKRKAWVHSNGGTSSQRGYGAKWQRIRKAALMQDDHLCRPCRAQGVYTPAKEVDHILPKANGGTDHLSNLQGICVACHKIKTRNESADARTSSECDQL